MDACSPTRARLGSWLLTCALVLSGVVPALAQAPPPPKPKPKPASAAEQSTSAQNLIRKTWTGDYDGMVKRRSIRILTPYSKTHYFIDRGVQRGIVYDAGMLLEQSINKQLKTTPATKVHVVFVPTSRDALYESLVGGLGDIIAAGVVITPERTKLVDFTIPGRTSVSQVLVTGPGAPAILTVTDLSGKQIAVRDKGLQFDTLTAMNAQLKTQGKPLIDIKAVPSSLEDEDILEMVSSGLLKATIVDDAIGQFWAQILPSLTVHPDVVVRKGDEVAWAVRKGSPKLLAVLNPFAEANKMGTLFGNEVFRRYLKSTKFVKSATSDAELQKFKTLMAIFEKYGKQYNLDYLLMMAQGYQESQLNQSAKSKVGAVGVMQVMPSTGKELKVGDIHQTESNVHAGVKYIRFMVDQYFADQPIDRLNKGLFAFAAYNCGPGRLAQLRREAAAQGLDKNVWFNNVERIAEKRIGRETVQYVSNIYKYYIAYRLTVDDWSHKDTGQSAPVPKH
jgi:membrane-bound lytic murein transglycosylase MltF